MAEHLKGTVDIDADFTYCLGDDSGVSHCYHQELLLPIGTEFLHAYGLYKVCYYWDENGHCTADISKVDRIYCERVKSNRELEK